MNKHYLFSLAICFVFFTRTLLSQIPDSDFRGLPQWSWGKHKISEYYLYTPDNMETDKKYPIVLFLHGADRDHNEATWDNVTDPLVRMWHNFEENTQEVPTYIIAGATVATGWGNHFKNLKFVIDSLVQYHQADSSRIIISGFSMGGGGAWSGLYYYPNYFAAAIITGSEPGYPTSSFNNIPIWGHVGYSDPYAPNMDEELRDIRELNGGLYSKENWRTGVNPRLTVYANSVHEDTRYKAGRRQELLDWAYSRVNDGNIYPNIYFTSPTYNQYFKVNEKVPLNCITYDEDGTISKVEIFVNGVLVETLTSEPFSTEVEIHMGDNFIEAKAYDNGGKTATASIIAGTDNIPTNTNNSLPDAQQGDMYDVLLSARGNEPFSFGLDEGSDPLPDGLYFQSGRLKGIPVETGQFSLQLKVADRDNDLSSKTLTLHVAEKSENEILVTNAETKTRFKLKTSKMKNGEHPFIDGEEFYLSDVGAFEGFTYLITPPDGKSTDDDYLTFEVDEKAIVYVAYEKMDFNFTSTIPSWLNGYSKDLRGEIELQYYYYDVYKKVFPAGIVTLGGADAPNNNVHTNYFVMVKKYGAGSMDTDPEISNTELPTGYLAHNYLYGLNSQSGNGKLVWEIVNGELPKGLNFNNEGVISGCPKEAGDFPLSIQVTDIDTTSHQVAYTLKISDKQPYGPIKANTSKEIALCKGGCEQDVVLDDVSNFIDDTQDISIELSTDNISLLDIGDIVDLGQAKFSFKVKSVGNETGNAKIFVSIKDNNNPDEFINTGLTTIQVTVEDFEQVLPSCDPVEDKVFGLDQGSMQSITVYGVTDGNDGKQELSFTITDESNEVLADAYVVYEQGADSAVLFIPVVAVGEKQLKLSISDGMCLDGECEYSTTMNIKVVETLSIDNILTDPQVLKVSPNPVNLETFTIEIGDNIEGKKKLQIIHLNGTVLFMQEVTQNSISLSTDIFPSAGLYLVLISSKDGNYLKKVIVE